MILLSQAAEAAQVLADSKWWAQPGATLIGGALVFAAAWVAYCAQAKTRVQERKHHRERLAEEKKARGELVEAQREEWEARIIHERKEARRTELLKLYGSMLEMGGFVRGWATLGFSTEFKVPFPDDPVLFLASAVAPRDVARAFFTVTDAMRERDEDKALDAVNKLTVAIRKHLATFDASPRLDSEVATEPKTPSQPLPEVTPT